MVLKKRYKGNTLPEVLIAMAIITFTSTIGIVIYINIQQNTQPFIKLKASELAAKYLLKSEREKDYFDKSFKEEEFTIKQTITRVDNYPDCLVLKISVSTLQEKKISELQKLIHAN